VETILHHNVEQTILHDNIEQTIVHGTLYNNLVEKILHGKFGWTIILQNDLEQTMSLGNLEIMIWLDNVEQTKLYDN
jgi:hypothetical protein